MLIACVFVTLEGVHVEGNPLMHYVISNYGLVTFAALKLLVLASCYMLFRNYNKERVKMWTLSILSAMMLYVVILGFMVLNVIIFGI